MNTKKRERLELILRNVTTIWGPTGYRSITPDQTFSNLGGILKMLDVHTVKKIPEEETYGIPIFKIQRKESDEFLEHLEKPEIFRYRAYGKGLGSSQSRISGIMELIERYSADKGSDFKTFNASYEELGGTALDPRSILPDYRYEPLASEERMIPKRVMEWCRGYSLVRKREIFVPAFAVFCPYTDIPFDMRVTPNGIASGNSREEAILHGMCELVERDAFEENIMAEEEFDYDRLRMLRLDESILKMTPPRFRTELSGYLFAFPIRNRRFDLKVHSFSTGVILTELVDDDIKKAIARGKSFYYRAGRGSHPDPAIAFLRSLAELAEIEHRQSKSAINSKIPVSALEDYFETVKFDTLKNQSTGSIKGDIEKCIDVFEKNGMDIIAVDLTRKEIGVAVVRIIIPGLRHQRSYGIKVFRFRDKA